MPRAHCPRCHYPLRTCICHGITEVVYRTRIVVLQHPSETAHAKNTARLIPLVTKSCEITVGETPDDFAEVKHGIEANPAAVVLFPAQQSAALADEASAGPIDTLVVLDGTWRKAKKIWLANPWLQTLRVCHLNNLADTDYRIRRSKLPNSLSTIEATAVALGTLENTPTEPLLKAFETMQSHWPEMNSTTSEPGG
jgi:DTW domain-containing protein YfiP